MKKRIILKMLLLALAITLPTVSDAQDRKNKCDGYMEHGMMGYGMMGPMMGHGMGMGMCSLSTFKNAKVTISETKDGGTITYTATDKKDIDRIHKILQMSKLERELREDSQNK